MSHTKVIATIGPTSESKDVMRELFKAGVNVCRLNFSHGGHDEQGKRIQNVIELNQELNTNVTILADLQGPKLRIGEVENNGVMLEDGNEVDFVTTPVLGTAKELYMSYAEFPKDVEMGEAILIDDGKIKLEVIGTNNIDRVRTKVIHGGLLSSKKGVNLPNTNVSLPSLTEKDMKDAVFALEHNVDWIAMSFVRSAKDLLPLRELIHAKKKSVKIIAKIEKPEALKDLDAIIDAFDGIMVARGDLGVEIPFDRVPMIQKMIVKKCIEEAKPVIIATQMLESMITNFSPTRAEANDVANAVLDGTDAVMLSAETSAGRYPIEAVKAMRQIISWTELNGFEYNRETLPDINSKSFLADSICLNACRMASQSNAKAIVVFTFSGYTAQRIAGYRPEAEVFVFTSNRLIVRKMALVWGMHAYYSKDMDTIDNSIAMSVENLKNRGYIKEGDVVVHVGSTPFEGKGKTNMIKLSRI
ncbi:MAG: pyruvate kinase [Prevotellaceae bacterium]|jgi:pyruvate kinase|nr:pyruvate kinase [Prevotellaceae bacterium]